MTRRPRPPNDAARRVERHVAGSIGGSVRSAVNDYVRERLFAITAPAERTPTSTLALGIPTLAFKVSSNNSNTSTQRPHQLRLYELLPPIISTRAVSEAITLEVVAYSLASNKDAKKTPPSSPRIKTPTPTKMKKPASRKPFSKTSFNFSSLGAVKLQPDSSSTPSRIKSPPNVASSFATY